MPPESQTAEAKKPVLVLSLNQKGQLSLSGRWLLSLWNIGFNRWNTGFKSFSSCDAFSEIQIF
jgi:hypothetical protein